jgi:cytochrome c551/c552
MKWIWWCLILAVLIQLVPYGHAHTNPAATKEPRWDSSETASLFHRACYNCHSNDTKWPWYSNVAPISWLVQRDVNGGRAHLNFTQWDQPQRHAKDVTNEVKEGDMPPWFYLPMHPNARLSEVDKQTLISGAGKTLGPQAAPKESGH